MELDRCTVMQRAGLHHSLSVVNVFVLNYISLRPSAVRALARSLLLAPEEGRAGGSCFPSQQARQVGVSPPSLEGCISTDFCLLSVAQPGSQMLRLA